MGTATGSLRRVTIAGRTYDVYGDTNITFNRNKFEKEGQATTGKTLVKFTLRVRTVESVNFATTPGEMEALNAVAEGLAAVPMSFELADGSIYRGTGHVNFESYESETGKSTCTLIPEGDWTPFLA